MCKLLSWAHTRKNAELSATYLEIANKTGDARRFFRLFKSIFEVKRIKLIVASSSDRFSLVVNVCSRAFYCVRYLFENIYTIAKACNVHYYCPNFPLRKFKQLSRTMWLIGLALFLIYCTKVLRQTYKDESDLKVAALNRMTTKEVLDNLQIICKLRQSYWLNFSRALLDFIVCFEENDLPSLMLGKRLNPGFEGLCGIGSAAIYLFGLKGVILN